MSDLLGIASTAVSAYQRALSTVSNNIANANTVGYSEQTSDLEANAPQKLATTYMGTGVTYNAVTRQSDVFAQNNVRSSNSDLAAETPMVDYANQVINIMGDKSIGLSSALDQFFKDTNALSADPASGDARNTFLSSLSGVAARFSEVSNQLKTVGNDAQTALQSASDQVNTLTTQLALINGQLTAHASEKNQPAQLLDQRDLLLNQLSQLTRINTSFTANGTVTVSLGGTITQSVVVDGQKAIPIGLNPKSGDPLSIILDPYGMAQNLAGASGGTIGGLKTFVGQVLQPAQKSLNSLATIFVDQVNQVQNNGIDGYGTLGQNLLSIDPSFANSSEGIKVIQSDGMRIATGSQFRVTENTSNPDSVKASVNYTAGPKPIGISNPNLSNNPNVSAGVPVSIQGNPDYQAVTTVAAGVNNPVFYLDNAQTGQQLQVLTKEGRQLIGSPLSIDQQYQILTPGNGFSQPLTYTTQYLNQSGTKGYMGTNVFYGAKADPQVNQQFDSQGNLAPSTLSAAVLQSGRINLGQTGTVIQAGALQLDGVSMGALTAKSGPPNQPGGPATLTLDDVKNWINGAGLTDITVDKVNSVNVSSKQIDFTKPLTINGVTIGSVSPGASGPTQYNNLQTLVSAIQASSAQTNVTASIDQGGNLVLTNMPGHEGENISLVPSLGASPSNALGIASQVYTGQIQITRKLGDANNSSIQFSFGPNGSPRDLSAAGFRTGAYITGAVPDDLQVFVTGAGTASVAASYQSTPVDPQQKLRNQSISINFTSANHYVINDVATGTELASRDYDPTVTNPVVNYQGAQIILSSAPQPGDSFVVDGNKDGLGDNQNALAMANLASKKVTNGMTIADNYIGQVNSVGNVSQQATITKQALTVVNNQAIAARDAVSGVNLDTEAASLIKYQQAYQAAAKAMQIAGQLFDTIVQMPG
jgi:flagellar hook-associated protein 1